MTARSAPAAVWAWYTFASFPVEMHPLISSKTPWLSILRSIWGVRGVRGEAGSAGGTGLGEAEAGRPDGWEAGPGPPCCFASGGSGRALGRRARRVRGSRACSTVARSCFSVTRTVAASPRREVSRTLLATAVGRLAQWLRSRRSFCEGGGWECGEVL